HERRGSLCPVTFEDVDQETFLVFCELLNTWQSHRGVPFKAYLARNAPLRLCDYVRRSLNFRVRLVELPSGNQGKSPNEPESEEAQKALALAEDQSAWDQHAQYLNPPCKRLIVAQ